MSDLTLGQKVRYRRRLWRTGSVGPWRGTERKRWERTPQWAPLDRTGVVVGLRTLQDGYTVFGTIDEPAEWIREGSVPAVLVAFDLRVNPEYVHPDDVEPI